MATGGCIPFSETTVQAATWNEIDLCTPGGGSGSIVTGASAEEFYDTETKIVVDQVLISNSSYYATSAPIIVERTMISYNSFYDLGGTIVVEEI